MLALPFYLFGDDLIGGYFPNIKIFEVEGGYVVRKGFAQYKYLDKSSDHWWSDEKYIKRYCIFKDRESIKKSLSIVDPLNYGKEINLEDL